MTIVYFFQESHQPPPTLDEDRASRAFLHLLAVLCERIMAEAEEHEAELEHGDKQPLGCTLVETPRGGFVEVFPLCLLDALVF